MERRIDIILAVFGGFFLTAGLFGLYANFRGESFPWGYGLSAIQLFAATLCFIKIYLDLKTGEINEEDL